MDTGMLDVLLRVLQRGVTEARTCALVGDVERAAALLDALDNIPRHLAAWSQASEQAVLLQLRSFDNAYPNHATQYASLVVNRTSVL